MQLLYPFLKVHDKNRTREEKKLVSAFHSGPVQRTLNLEAAAQPDKLAKQDGTAKATCIGNEMRGKGGLQCAEHGRSLKPNKMVNRPGTRAPVYTSSELFRRAFHPAAVRSDAVFPRLLPLLLSLLLRPFLAVAVVAYVCLFREHAEKPGD